MVTEDNIKLVDKDFGLLKVLSFAGRINGKKYWNVICSCKNKTMKPVREDSLLGGKTKSCGCLAPNSNGPKKSLRPKEDLSGITYGRLEVIEFHGWYDDGKRRRPVFLCRCSCASESILPVRADLLKSGNTRSCGCLKKENKSGGRKPSEFPSENLTGQIFTRLKVLRFAYRDKKRFYYECECSCGTIDFYRGDSLKDETTKSCGCLSKDNTGPNPKEDREIAVINKLYGVYRRAENFDIEYARFVLTVKSPCEYCGGFDLKSDKYSGKKFPMNGIDRTDSKGGYLLSNIVSCCKKCNYMKHSLSIEKFVTWIIKFNINHHKIINFPFLEESIIEDNLTFKSFANRKFKETQRSSEKRNRVFDLSKELFNELIQQPCTYCGCFSKVTKDGYFVNGIDRVNNAQSYIKTNVVTCCKTCNKAKHTNSRIVFINHVYKLLPFAIKFLKSENIINYVY
ncbi:HNH endonuclease signature motif containing protein [Psychrobacillus psychrotolerans]|uniref:HNH endonuclease signature motif containing protein n=1 Tax=Psychrobacillus psychrotolerans TaxID=126156 RepID=UPI003B02498F